MSACRSLDIALVGGHTEVTRGLDRPILAGFVLGKATPDTLVTSSGAQEGDDIILTKGIAIEVTTALALEHGPLLAAKGVHPDLVRRAAGTRTRCADSCARWVSRTCACPSWTSRRGRGSTTGSPGRTGSRASRP